MTIHEPERGDGTVGPTNCQVLGFMCRRADLCSRCGGTGNEPLMADGSDPCCGCDRCFDEVVGWCTGVEPGSAEQARVRQFIQGERAVAEPEVVLGNVDEAPSDAATRTLAMYYVRVEAGNLSTEVGFQTHEELMRYMMAEGLLGEEAAA